jgi:hypothetical protein
LIRIATTDPAVQARRLAIEALTEHFPSPAAQHFAEELASHSGAVTRAWGEVLTRREFGRSGWPPIEEADWDGIYRLVGRRGAAHHLIRLLQDKVPRRAVAPLLQCATRVRNAQVESMVMTAVESHPQIFGTAGLAWLMAGRDPQLQHGLLRLLPEVSEVRRQEVLDWLATEGTIQLVPAIDEAISQTWAGSQGRTDLRSLKAALQARVGAGAGALALAHEAGGGLAVAKDAGRLSGVDPLK